MHSICIPKNVEIYWNSYRVSISSSIVVDIVEISWHAPVDRCQKINERTLKERLYSDIVLDEVMSIAPPIPCHSRIYLQMLTRTMLFHLRFKYYSFICIRCFSRIFIFLFFSVCFHLSDLILERQIFFPNHLNILVIEHSSFSIPLTECVGICRFIKLGLPSWFMNQPSCFGPEGPRPHLEGAAGRDRTHVTPDEGCRSAN